MSDDTAIIATTGKCGRELFTLADRAQHLYQVGSMGCASAMGLGVALHTDRPVIVLDGDGAADLAVANSFSQDVSILRNRGDAGFSPAESLAAPDGGSSREMRIDEEDF